MYYSQRIGWRYCYQTIGKCYISRNVNLMKLHLSGLQIRNLYHVSGSSNIHLSQYGDEGQATEDGIDEYETQNPSKTCTYQQTGEDGNLIGEDSPPSLKR